MLDEIRYLWRSVLVALYRLIGDWDTPESSGNLPYGVKLEVEPGTGLMVVPCTKHDFDRRG